jgi:hypothetical protein
MLHATATTSKTRYWLSFPAIGACFYWFSHDTRRQQLYIF